MQGQSTGNRFPQYFFVWESISHFLLENDFAGYMILGWWLFSLNTSCVSLFTSCMNAFWDIRCNSYVDSYIGNVFFSYWLFLFFLYFWYSAIWICYAWVSFFLTFILLGVPRTSKARGLVSDITLGRFSVITVSKISSLSLSLFFGISVMSLLLLFSFPQFLDNLFQYFFQSFFHFAFQFCKFLFIYPKLRDSFLRHVQSTVEPIIFLHNFWFLVFLFDYL